MGPDDTHRHPHLSCAALLVFSLSCLSAASAAESADDSPDSDDPCAEMKSKMETLWSGQPEDKQEAAENGSDWFDPFCHSSADDNPDTAARVVDSLRDWLRTEKDDWISSRLLASLLTDSSNTLAPLFRDALESSSPNVRLQGIRWYAGHDDPDALPALEEAWRTESRPWMRADLLAALGKLGSKNHLDDFLRLGKADDPALAAAAIEALGASRDPQAVPGLSAIARGGRPFLQAKALGALRAWPDSAQALNAVLDLTRSPDPRLQADALEALKGFDDPAATKRFIEVVRSGEGSDIRQSAVEGLQSARDPEMLPALLGVVHEPSSHDNAALQSEALRVLHNLDDASAIPGLLDLDPELGSDSDSNVGALIEYLSRDRTKFDSTRSEVTRTYEFGESLDPRRFEATRVSPPAPLASIRCWEAPEIAGNPALYLRLPAGEPRAITEYFERGDELWVRTDGPTWGHCWVSRRYLDVAAAPSPSRRNPLLHREFDLPTADLRSDVAAELLKTGLLEVIDPDDDVTGIRLILDPSDRGQIAILARSFRFTGDILDAQILDIASRVAPLYARDPTLGPLLKFTKEHSDEVSVD